MAGTRRSHKRTGFVVVALVVIAAGAAAAFALGSGGDNGDSAAGAELPPATTKVVTTDLVQTEQVPGIVSYGVPYALPAGSVTGVVTWMPAMGDKITLGSSVYKVDDRPVVLFHGTVPLYRTLEPGVAGADVLGVEESLSALGYTGFDLDDTYTSATAAAVYQWQADVGLEPTGVVTPDQVVVSPGDIRVALPGVVVGGKLGGELDQPVMTITGTNQFITVGLDVSKQYLVKPGIAATVTLPDGTAVPATVTSVGTVATVAEAGDGQAAAAPSVTVQIALSDLSAVGPLDSVPVQVNLVSDEREAVLAVPVVALVALSEGGYGVRVVDGDKVDYVPVETGMFAGGKVEISGNGISEGTVVGVPG